MLLDFGFTDFAKNKDLLTQHKDIELVAGMLLVQSQVQN